MPEWCVRRRRPECGRLGDASMDDRAANGAIRRDERYVVTLCASSMAMPVRLPRGLEIQGASVFRSRAVEDGRERFRLHLGYFDSIGAARDALIQVRDYFPTALVGNAPPEQSGSLDDTLNTDFSLVRGAIARLVTREEMADAERAPTLTPREVASVMAPQRYAVQLEWSVRPMPANSIPRLGIFRAYCLYGLSVLRKGSPEYGLRLGFFKNIDAARQVANYVRDRFPCASVVPVSYREYERATDVARSAARSVASAEPAVSAPAASAAAEPAAPLTPAGAPASTAEIVTREELLALLGPQRPEPATAISGTAFLPLQREEPAIEGPGAALPPEERVRRTRRPQRGQRRG